MADLLPSCGPMELDMMQPPFSRVEITSGQRRRISVYKDEYLARASNKHNGFSAKIETDTK
jgi:hypothetical protein